MEKIKQFIKMELMGVVWFAIIGFVIVCFLF